MNETECLFSERHRKTAPKTGASTATISRVNRCLHYGTDGYKLAIDRVKEKKEKENKE